MRKHVAQLADDTVRRDDRLLGPQTIGPAFVQDQHMGAVRTAGANHLRRHCFGNVLLLKAKHRLQTTALRGVFRKGCLFRAQTQHLSLQLLRLVARMAQVDVVPPKMPQMQTRPVRQPLDRRHRSHGPAPQQRDLRVVRTFARAARNVLPSGRTLHLQREAEHLGQNHSDQHQRIAESGEKLHKTGSRRARDRKDEMQSERR